MGSSWVSMETPIPEDKQNAWLGAHYGFWAKDAQLLIWLAALGEIIDEVDGRPHWLKKLRAEWDGAYCGVGCVDTCFNEYLTDESRCQELLIHVQATVQRLLDHQGDFHRAFPGTKQRDDLERDGPIPIGEKVGVIEIGSNLARLLQGSFHGGEHSPVRWGHAPL